MNFKIFFVGALLLVIACNKGPTKKEDPPTGPAKVLEIKSNDSVVIVTAEGKRKTLRKEEITFDWVREIVLQPYCIECHSQKAKRGGVDLSSFLGASQILQPGHPENSPLWTSISQRRMPPRPPAPSDQEMSVLRIWIEAGAKEHGQASAGPTATSPTDEVLLEEISFRGITQAFMQNDCNGCHNGTAAMSFLNYEDFVGIKRMVNTEDVTQSRFYQSVVANGEAEPMPPKQGYADAEYKNAVLAAIKTWMEDGARETVDGPVLEPEPDGPVLEEVSFKGITDALLGPQCNECHQIEAIGDFTSYASLMSKEGRIDLKNPKNSNLYRTVAGTQTTGGIMPPDGLNENFRKAALKMIETWIAAGAPE